ncbi:MAG: OmpA family protein, partial [Nitrospiraceae bacterium]|nr:OmpA family protein [Nitrospiraceae bacterium]
MKKFLLVLAIVGFVAAGCSHAVKQSPEQAVQAAPAPQAAPAAPAAQSLKPAAAPSVSESAQSAEAAAVTQAEKVGDIHFAFDKYDLNNDAKATLKDLSGILMKDSSMTVLIAGRCDERGTEEYNLALGDKRASAAKKYLVALG